MSFVYNTAKTFEFFLGKLHFFITFFFIVLKTIFLKKKVFLGTLLKNGIRGWPPSLDPPLATLIFSSRNSIVFSFATRLCDVSQSIRLFVTKPSAFPEGFFPSGENRRHFGAPFSESLTNRRCGKKEFNT